MSKYLTGDQAGIEEFLNRFDVFLFDCDGVLWSGDHLFEGTVETLEMLRSKGKQIVFVTNNSTKSRADYKKKLESMGIPASVDEVFGSSYSAAIYISRILPLPPSQKTVFVLGESGIETELDSESIPNIGGTDPLYNRPISPADYTSIASGSALDPSVGVVLAGLDFHLNYLKLAYARQIPRHKHRYNLAVCGIAVSGGGGDFGAVGSDDGGGEADGVWEAESGDDGCD
ncbi:MAG: hypothetical protein Q9200_000981 [Gallowayella weberi]